MAAPVGNLLRKLEESISRESDPLIHDHLQKIFKELDKALPFLHDAELKRELQQVKPKRKIRIGKWVTLVVALAIEVDDIITSYDVHIMNKKTGSLYTKLIYWYFFFTNNNSVSAKIRKFCSNGDQLITNNSKFNGFHFRVPNIHGYVSLVETNSQSWIKNLLAMGLLELLERFEQKVTKEIEFLIMKALDLNLTSDALLPNHNYLEDPVQNILESAMVGRHKEITLLESLLLTEDETSDDSDQKMVIGVTGVAGIGKTTVVKAVYERLRHQFDCYAWVFVSSCANTKILLQDVLKDVLKRISVMLPSNVNSMDVSLLEKMIQKHLVGKKFLLVLDDVLVPDVCEIVKRALPLDCRAKIILTSRKNLPFCRSVLPLNPLTHQEARFLLQKCASKGQKDTKLWVSVPSEASKILNRCGRLPLAIVTIGGLLSTKRWKNENQWAKIRDMFMRDHFIPLCYADMHPVLKSCFLYAASFPLHFEIPCKRLLRLWLAEGFVQEGTTMTMEEAVKFHLKELIQRNMIQVDRVGIDGQMETCRVLEPMRQFALKRSEQDQFSTSVHNTEQSMLPESPHRLFLSSERSKEIEKLNLSRIRSLISFKGSNHQSFILTATSKNRFNLLRVLELQWLPDENLSNDVLGQLSQLRYLGLRGTRLKKLPKSLRKLQRLQILDIRDTFVLELPSGLEDLKMLRHLLLAGSFGEKVVNLEVEIQNFSNLQTLAGVKLTERIAKGLNHLSQVQKLSVGEVKSFFAEDLFNAINHMKLLQSLTMKCARKEEVNLGSCTALNNLKKLRIGGRVMNLLECVTKIYSLKYLYLWDCMLVKDPLSALQHLPSLVLLSLCNAYDGEEIKFGKRGFRKLNKLSILHCKGLEKWIEIKDGSMRKLQMLTIAYCPKLSMFPKGLEKLTCLQVLQVSHMPEHFINAARIMKSSSSSKFSILVRETTQLSSPVNAAPATKMLPMPTLAY